MSLTPYLLLFVGLILIFLEFYLPGAVMAILGGISLVAGLLLLISEKGSVEQILLYLFLLIVGLTVTIRLALFCIRRSSGRMFLNSDQEGFTSGEYDKALIGREATAHTSLHPGGFVMIDQEKYAAISVTGYISAGEVVEVIEIEGETLKVRKKCLS